MKLNDGSHVFVLPCSDIAKTMRKNVKNYKASQKAQLKEKLEKEYAREDIIVEDMINDYYLRNPDSKLKREKLKSTLIKVMKKEGKKKK